MKKLIIPFLLLISITSYAQLGISGHYNVSYFGGGDPTYKGIEHAGGNYGFGVFQKIHLNEKFDLQWEANYLGLGIKNPIEQDRRYKPKYIYVPITLSYKIGDFDLQAGGYVHYMLKAKNDSWYLGGNFDWSAKGWRYIHRTNFGGVVGIGYNAYNAYFAVHYIFDLRQMRNEDWDNGRMIGNKNRAIIFSLYIPYSTFKN